MEDFLLCLHAEASQLHVLGDDFTDKEVIKKMLHVILDKLEQVAIMMETLLDLDSLLIKEAIGHLHTIEQRKTRSSSKESGGCPLLTEEEWMVRMKSRDGTGSNASAWNDGDNKGDRKNKHSKPSARGERKTEASRDDVCGYCGKRAAGLTNATRRRVMRKSKPIWPKVMRRSRVC
jgi:hypothetical protein